VSDSNFDEWAASAAKSEPPCDKVFAPLFTEQHIDLIIKAACGLPDGEVDSERFDETQQAFISVRVSRKAELTHRLNGAAHIFQLKEALAKKASPSSLAKNLQLISSAATSLLRALETTNKDSSNLRHRLALQAEHDGAMRITGFAHNPPTVYSTKGIAVVDHLGVTDESITVVDYLGDTQLGADIEGVARIQKWAAAGYKRERRKLENKGGARRRVPKSYNRHTGDKALDDLFFSLKDIWVKVFERVTRTSVGGPGTANEGKAIGPFVEFIARRS
jgi:hypothetical protein